MYNTTIHSILRVSPTEALIGYKLELYINIDARVDTKAPAAQERA